MGIKKLHWNSSSSFRFLGFQSFSHFFFSRFHILQCVFSRSFRGIRKRNQCEDPRDGTDLVGAQREQSKSALTCAAVREISFFSQMTFGKKRSIVIEDCKKKINGIWLEMIFLLFGLKK